MSQAARHLRVKDPVIERRYEPNQNPQVMPRKRVTVGEKLLWSASAIVVLILAICIVANQAHLYKNTHQISQLQEKVDTQSKANQQLNVEVTKLSAPERIYQYAKNKLGLTLDIKNVKVLP